MTQAVSDPCKSATLVVFSVGPLRFGIDVREVAEVIRMLPISMPLPGNRGVVGITTVRGESTTIIDVARVVGLEDHQATATRLILLRGGESHVCLQVDRVDGLRDVNDENVALASSVGLTGELCWTSKVIRDHDGGLIGLFNWKDAVAWACQPPALNDSARNDITRREAGNSDTPASRSLDGET